MADYCSIGFAELTNIGICLKLFAFHDKYYKYEKIQQGNLLVVGAAADERDGKTAELTNIGLTLPNRRAADRSKQQ